MNLEAEIAALLSETLADSFLLGQHPGPEVTQAILGRIKRRNARREWLLEEMDRQEIELRRWFL